MAIGQLQGPATTELYVQPVSSATRIPSAGITAISSPSSTSPSRTETRTHSGGKYKNLFSEAYDDNLFSKGCAKNPFSGECTTSSSSGTSSSRISTRTHQHSKQKTYSLSAQQGLPGGVRDLFERKSSLPAVLRSVDLSTSGIIPAQRLLKGIWVQGRRNGRNLTTLGGTGEGKREAESGALQGQFNLMGDQTVFRVCEERYWTRGYCSRRSPYQPTITGR